MIEVKPVEVDVDAKALRIFLKSIEILGGPRKLVEMRNLTWLPSLMAASYAIVYAKDKNYTAERIAEILGLSKQTVQNILRADPEALKARIEEALQEEEEEKKTHTAISKTCL
jgi:probable regulatory domain-containing protein